MRPLTTPLARLAALVAATAGLAAACGDDPSDTTTRAERPCPVAEHPDAPTPLSLHYQGASWLDGAVEAAIERYNASQADVRVTATAGDGLIGADMVAGADTVLVQAYVSELGALAAAGEIIPLEPCLLANGHDFSSYMPQALAGGRIDGVQWALPANVETYLMLYDRNAFRAAGLDPDRPPATVDELVTTARALKANAGYEHPVALGELAALLGAPVLTSEPSPMLTPDAREAVSALATLGQEGLLHPGVGPRDGPTLLGLGEVALETGGMGFIWGLGHALADGQAPGADMGVAPLPGVRGPRAFAGGSYFALDADATPEQMAAAARLLEWVEAPAQQAELHVISDRLPSRAAAVTEPAITTYWEELPLMGEAWEAYASAPVAIEGVTVTGGFAVNDALAPLATGQIGEEQAAEAVAVALDRSITAQERAPAEHLSCVAAALRAGLESHEPPDWHGCVEDH